MSRYYYDLHLHSCLSPCGDDESTPNSIAGMASLCGLDIIALTDHNSTKNCPGFFEAAERYGVVPIAGMELTTSEDIHVVCLFERLSDAMSFDAYVDNHRMKVSNRPEIFGNQAVTDSMDNKIDEIEHLLINATDISIEQIRSVVEDFGGICYPAHIDRPANGIIAVLGTIPSPDAFDFYELQDIRAKSEYSIKYGIPEDRLIISSDAHYLTDMRDKEAYFELDCSGDADSVRRSLFEYLKR